MLWVKSDRLRNFAFGATFTAVFLAISIGSGFAQEPPLSVPLAGSLPSASSGCDAGLAGAGGGLYNNLGLYPSSGPTASSGPANAGSNDLGAPLYSTPNDGVNAPLYSTPVEGENAPLNSTATPGVNAPLYSNSSLYNYPGLYGGANLNNGLGGVPNIGPTQCRSGIPIGGGWLIYPSIRLYSLYSNNLFLAPSSPIGAWGYGATPTVTAQWTNGIHSTTIFANVDTQQYPTDNLINTFDRQATFTQKYSPLPDLTFTALADYTHKTVPGSLTSSIPDLFQIRSTTPTRLPDGNIELPNGLIISPTGQIVGSVAPGATGNGQTS